MVRFVWFAASAALVAGCANDRSAPPAAVPQHRASSQTVADPGEAVWHLRAGLNVAALSCRGRGRTGVAGAYSKMLSRHRSLLASAYSGEQRRYGKGLDRHLTQLYNRFANQPSPARFCASAATIADEALRMDSAALSGQARRLLGRLG
jgi:hypothetical protein